jgi:imidazolonepropionase
VAGVSINGALQVVRPPAEGLPYLRHDRAGELVCEPGSVALDGERIAGLHSDPAAAVQVDAGGCAVIPGFVDCHTHLPFAGWREREYELKIAGASYESIAREGGGIRSSARSLAASSDEAVLGQAGELVASMLAHGTTAFECKSGYGLSVDGELRALRLASALGGGMLQRTRSTALLAHAVPDGYSADGWIDEVEAMLPAVVGLGSVSALDIYVESVAFTNVHLERIGELAAANGLDLRAHVEQFNWNGSVPVAVSLGARSVDHLACLPEEEVGGLADSETAAVLLPGAEFLGGERLPPARALADAGAICVLGTDLNPGTSPVLSMPLVIGLAVRRYRWSVRETLLAATLNAAWVLRLSDQVGSIEAGKRADVVVIDGPVERIPYRFGHNPVALVFAGGELVWVRPDFAPRVAGARIRGPRVVEAG